MPDAVLIFSLGPVQGFLKEARRAQDLWAGSKWLSDMARAAIQACLKEGAKAIYPADPQQDSLPNKFVVRLPKETLDPAVRAACKAAQGELERCAQEAKHFLQRTGVPTDDVWETIWQRQCAHHLEFFWAAAEIAEGNYRAAYQQASQAFEAAKRTRVFNQVPGEEGLKDSLSGRRSALRTRDKDAREYWKAVGNSKGVTPSHLKPDGRERLDALGATKRFGFPEAERFPSVSTVAVADFLERARGNPALQAYSKALAPIPLLYRVRDDEEWPYDGDLLFAETLSPQRLQTSYGFGEDDLEKYARHLEAARLALQALYQALGRPNPYYAILVMDGDSMGERVNRCAIEEEHAELSRRLVDFALQARQTVEEHQGWAVYTGGDDVLALLPVCKALPAAQALAQKVAKTVPKGTVSAGIAVTHHLYPLDAALQAAREAEKVAKRVPGKAAVAVTVVKRSGETLVVRSKWDNLGGLFGELVGHFAGDRLSSRFAYDLSERAPVVTALTEARGAALKQLVYRHKGAQLTDADGLVKRMVQWAQALDDQTPSEEVDGVDVPQGLAELARWVVFARFVAQGGGE
jgi:CRISPR-associated protein Cmr2